MGEDGADEVGKRGRAYEVVGMPLMQRLERVQWDREPSKGDLARFVTVASEWRYDAQADDARAQDAARLAEAGADALEQAAREATRGPGWGPGLSHFQDRLRVATWLRTKAAALGVTAPTASEAGAHRPVRDRNGSDGTPAVGCSCGASTCDMDGFREHALTVPAADQKGANDE